MPINWDETVPSDSDQFSGFPTQVRSLKSSFALAIANSLFWPGSGGGTTASAGSVKAGTARAIYDVQSNFSAPSSVSSGQAYIASDTSRLFGGGSSLTQFLGGARITEDVTYQGQTVVNQLVSLSTQIVDNAGTLGSSDYTTVRLFYAVAFTATSIECGVYANTSVGTNALTGVAASIGTSTTTAVWVNLQALSRVTSFPSAPSVTTLTVFIVSSGTASI